MSRTRSPYRWLLRLLPPSFREEYEDELVRTWRALQRESGRAGAAGFWRTALLDTLRTAAREYPEAFAGNLRVAGLQLRRAPGFAAAAILTLAVGMGATAGVFSLVNAILLRPLPFQSPDDVGLIWAVQPTGQRTWLSFPELEDLQAAAPAVSAVAGLTDLRMAASLGTAAEEVQALAVSHGFFRPLGVPPALGRDFTREDDREGAAPVVLLGDAFWRSRFAGDPDVLGRTMRLGDRDYTIAGVLPAAFSLLPASSVLPDRVDVWVTLEPHLASRERTVRFLHALARLRAGATFDQADAQLRAHAARAAREFAAAYAGGAWTWTIVSFEDDVLKQARSTLWLLFGLVVLVLLMACVNVTHLLLARAESRRPELAVRIALGAGPARLAGEQLAEVCLLVGCASVVGFALALLAPAVLQSIHPDALPRLADASMDHRVAAFTVGLASLTVLVSAAAPVADRWWSGFPAIGTSRSGGRTRRSVRLGRIFVVAQTAFATTVIVTAVFLTQALLGLRRVELGVAAADVQTARLSPSPRYPPGPLATQLFERATEAIARRPGVVGAAAISQLPMSGAMLGSTFIVDLHPSPRQIDGDLRAITGAYFQVAGTPLLAGRGFTADDSAASPRVAIVDETFARRMAPSGRVIGHRIRWSRQPDVELEIVGIAAAVRHRGPAYPARETVYRPLSQYPRPAMYVLARTLPGTGLTHADLRAALDTVDPTQPLADVSSMAERVARATARARTSVTLAAVLGACAAALGAVGLYGVLSVGVARRLHEFGVRLALGASPAAVRILVAREGLGLAFTGILAGTGAATAVVAIARSSMADAVAATGTGHLAGIGIVFACSAAALWLPARRAARTEPVALLRSE